MYKMFVDIGYEELYYEAIDEIKVLEDELTAAKEELVWYERQEMEREKE